MTVTAGRTYSPFAPRPDDSDYAPPAPEPASGEQPTTPVTAEPGPDVVSAPPAPTPVPTPTEAPKSTTDSDDNSRSTLETPHPENINSEGGPEVTAGDSAAETPHSTPNSTPENSDTQSPKPGESTPPAPEELTFKDAVGAWMAETGTKIQPLVKGWRPPAIWSQEQPPLKDVWTYATKAPWTSNELLRGISTVWACTVGFAVSAVAYYLAWIFQRGGRFLVALVFYVITSQTSYGDFLPWLW